MISFYKDTSFGLTSISLGQQPIRQMLLRSPPRLHLGEGLPYPRESFTSPKANLYLSPSEGRGLPPKRPLFPLAEKQTGYARALSDVAGEAT